MAAVNHHRAGRLLSAYIDSELTAAEMRAVHAHLLDCAVCREAYENLRAARELLGGLPAAEPPDECWAAIRNPATRGASGGFEGTAWLRAVRAVLEHFAPRGITVRRPAWALAAVLIVMALAAIPLVKGTVDRLHATEIGVDLYVHDHAMQMGTAPLVDRAYVGLVAGDAELVLAGETPRPVGDGVR